MATSPRRISNTRADRAGKALREWYMNPNSPSVSNLPRDHPVVQAAALMIFEFRPTFQGPLNKVAQGVRQFARAESGVSDPRVGQRLKREIMMIDKLARQGSLRLSQMQDVGGCRAILADRGQIDGVVPLSTGGPYSSNGCPIATGWTSSRGSAPPISYATWRSSPRRKPSRRPVNLPMKD